MGREKGQFKKGHVANPNGRPPIILPEVQRAIEANKNALKVVILGEMENKAAEWIRRIIEQGIGEGDIVRFKTLLEIALGKLVDDPPEFAVSEEEKLLVLEFRKRKLEQSLKGQPGVLEQTHPE